MIRKLSVVAWKLSVIAIRPVKFVRPALHQRWFILLLRRRGLRIVGRPSFIHDNIILDGTDYGLIGIGDRTTISRDVLILTHDYSIQRYLSRFPEHRGVALTISPVSIGANCFIGARTTLLPGARVGDGTVIGAGSIVRGEIPPGVVAAGNPAVVLCLIEEWGEKVRPRVVFE